MQFMMASERGNTRLSGRFGPLSPAFLRALRKIADKAREAGVPFSLCGEIAGRPLEAMALIGIGYRSLSMAPAAIGPVKAMIQALEANPMGEHLLEIVEKGLSRLLDEWVAEGLACCTPVAEQSADPSATSAICTLKVQYRAAAGVCHRGRLAVA